MHVSSTYRPQNLLLPQGNLSATAYYTFSAKERDPETGLSYFGARYYSSDLSIWLSVDPMAAKYPSLSPYVYCANNPIKLVDPNGEEVYIIGDAASVANAFANLQSGTNLKLTINEDGKISATGDALNENDQQLMEAINSSDVRCNIHIGAPESPGEYWGTIYDSDKKSAVSTNIIKLSSLKNLEREGASGSGIIHEITEGYHLGCYAINNAVSIPEYASAVRKEKISIGAGEYTQTFTRYIPIYPEWYEIFMQHGHSKATKAPNEMSRKEAKDYKKPSSNQVTI